MRPVNEDSVLSVRPQDPGQLGRLGVLVLVADGMGGAQGGEVASRIASETISRDYYNSTSDPAKALKKSVENAGKEIYRHAGKNRNLAGMGTTCVALVLRPPFAWAAWVGDSRLYLIRHKQIFQMTEDHSIVREMVRRGMLTTEEAGQHEGRNLVTRALGCHRKVEVAAWDQPFPVRHADRFLLCSDGLHDVVPDARILELADDGEVELATARLIEEAMRRGAQDNISAVLVEVAHQDLSKHPAPPTRDSRFPSEVSR
ncbi:MAG: PP2C family protein-serine/threonine phosphatase [Bryobacteraceae bacterium]